MANFQLAYNKVLKPNEGYWVNHPADRGGETYMGVARKFEPGWSGWPLIDAWKNRFGTPPKGKPLNITGLSQLVYDHFEKKYWTANSLHLIEDQNTATLCLDIVVLHGRGPKIINRALLTGPRATSNVVGNDTVSVINTDPKNAYYKILESRRKYFYEIVKNDPSQQVFMNGWLNKRYTPFLTPVWKWVEDNPGKAIAGGTFILLGILAFALLSKN